MLDKNTFRLATLRRKNLADAANLRELVWLAHQDDARILEEINNNGASLLKIKSYKIGAPGVLTAPDGTATDYQFNSAANQNEQSIQLGAANIIPALCPVEKVVVYCLNGTNGAITAAVDVGKTSGSDEWLSAVDIDDTDEITSATGVVPSVGASSVYFSITPDANWSTMSTGCWGVDVYYYVRTI